MTQSREEVSCPVTGCSYRGQPASVAGHVSGKRDERHDWQRLGYDGARHYKREQSQTQSTEEPTPVFPIITDSHVGKQAGGYGASNWKIDPLEDLETVLGFVDSLHRVDTKEGQLLFEQVLYTGDLFQNDRGGISNDDVVAVRAIFEELPTDVLPVLYICGNHARSEGRQVWNEFESAGLAQSLSTTPYVLGNTAIYGIDYHSEQWWESAPTLEPSSAPLRVLCLHQSVEPFRKSSTAEFDLRTLLPRLSTAIEGVPEVVIVGHMHEIIDEQISVDGQNVRVINAGSTTNIGATEDEIIPGMSLLYPDSGSTKSLRFPDEL